MINVVFFGERLGEMAKIHSSVEFAFETYRRKLTSFMQSIDTVIRKINRIDELSSKFVAVHDNFRDLAMQIPQCWEQNELILRKLSSSSSLQFVYAILPIVNDTGCNYIFNERAIPALSHAWSDAASSFAPKSSSYDSLEQVVIHLSRDWGHSGEHLRKTLYREGIIATLQEVTGAADTAQPMQILVPGAGLGRLAVELAMLGHR